MGINTRDHHQPVPMPRLGRDGVELGEEAQVDEGVWLGYSPAWEGASGPLTIGPGARIRFGTVIYSGTRIGRDLDTGHGVIIREGNVIGDNFRIWGYSSVDYGCQIGHNVKLHSNVYVCQFTILEDEVFIGPGSVLLNDRHPGCPKSKECLRGPTIKRGAQIGGGACILPGITIGEYALVGAGSLVTRDLPAGCVAYGNPARVRGFVDDLVCPQDLLDRPYGHRQSQGRLPPHR